MSRVMGIGHRYWYCAVYSVINSNVPIVRLKKNQKIPV